MSETSGLPERLRSLAGCGPGAAAICEMADTIEELAEAADQVAECLGARGDLDHKGNPLPDDLALGWVTGRCSLRRGDRHHGFFPSWRRSFSSRLLTAMSV